MKQLAILLRMRALQARHHVRGFLQGSLLRSVVVVGLIIVFWALMFSMFFSGFRFLHQYLEQLSDLIIDYLFSFFFLALLAMMIISNTVISYVALFRSEETRFLFTLPLHAQNTYSYRSSGSIIFSIWGMLTLVFPMVLAYGLVFPVPWYFYIVSIAMALLFTGLTTELGSFFALLVGAVMPRKPRTFTIIVLSIVAVLIALRTRPLWMGETERITGEGGLALILNKIDFCRHWALPSRWVSQSMRLAAAQDLAGAGFLMALMLSNTLFLPLVNHRLASHLYGRTWEAAQGAGGRRVYRHRGILTRMMSMGLLWLPRELRELVLKDIKTFLRDPSQWSQFLVFFGLLGLYVINLPTIGWTDMAPRWHSLITQLNLGASCLTLATLTSRFVYPQLSLEGRRIWITGLLPMRRTYVLWGKFLFAAGGTFVITSAIMVASDLILRMPIWMVGVHLLVLLGVCCGLNGLAVGLGALYPHMDSDNPAQIVSSFGGTLNLILSIVFITFALAPVVVVLHLYMLQGIGGRFPLWLGLALGSVCAISLVACLVPMLAGAKAFRDMEF